MLFGCKNTNEKKPIAEASPKMDVQQFQSIVDSIYSENPNSIGMMVHIESPKHGISWSGSSGYANIEKTAPLQADQPALIASSIKTYVAAAMLRLQENGNLNIEDPISKHLSQKTAELLKNDGYDIHQIKIKHLLSHTSGIADYVNDDYLDFIHKNQTYRWTRDEQLKLATKVGDPLGKPQELFAYADANYLLATEIMEQKTKLPFYTAMRKLLQYEDLGLGQTWFPTLEEQPKSAKPMVHQYWNEKDWGQSKLDFDWDSQQHDISWDLYGGGGIATTMKELAQFSYYLFNKKIVEDAAVLKLLTTDVATKDEIPKTYRLGIADAQVKGLQSFGHGGFWGTMVFYIPKLDTAISVCVLERNGKMKPIKALMNAYTNALTKHMFGGKSVVTEGYSLYKAKNSKATLVLFPGGGTNAAYTKQEFDIVGAANAHNISVLMLNFNRHLWIDATATKQLAKQLEAIFDQNHLKTKDLFIGGMSIGGNVALTLSNHLQQNHTNIAPKGIFIVDSPLDLYALYESSKKDIANPKFDKERLAEPKWIVHYFEEAFTKDSLLQNIQKVSPFTLQNSYTSVSSLKNTKVRFYTEPDSLWWKENRQTDFESTNAYTIQQITKALKAQSWKQLELIETTTKGYRANGDRHPHSWSIVDIRDLLDWMME